MGNIPLTGDKPRLPGFPKGRTWLYYGPQKIGKSTLAMLYPRPIAFDLEDGMEDIHPKVTFKNKPEGDERDPKLAAARLDWMSACLKEVEGKAGAMYDTVVVDTLDMVHDWVEVDSLAYLSKKLKGDYTVMGETPNGADWAESRRSTLGILTELRQFARRTGKNVVIVAHSQATMTEKGTKTEKAMTIDFPGKLGRRIPAQVDVVGYCYSDKVLNKEAHKSETARFVSFQPYEGLEVGCRYKELNGKVLSMSFKAIDDAFKSIIQK